VDEPTGSTKIAGRFLDARRSRGGPERSGGRAAVPGREFVNYNLQKGWYVTMQPVITANWVAPRARDVWTVPFGGGVGRIMKLGLQPVNISAQAYVNAAYPTGGSPWGLRLQIAFLFPQSPK
jgi:hypothetical protein